MPLDVCQHLVDVFEYQKILEPDYFDPTRV